MGQPATRITANDFLIPPELGEFQLAGNTAGRIGGLRLELISDATETRFGDCYQQVPLRVFPPFRFEPARPALVYVVSPTAGLMDGDGQYVELSVRSGATAVVVGQSATRIHPCLHGFATQQWKIHVEAGAALTLLPGPAIPFRGCRYFQRIAVDLEAGARLFLGDIWLAGRYARGAASELFQFETIVQEILVHRQGRLIYRDRFCWRGPWDKSAIGWHFGDAPACGSCFVTGPASEGALPSDPAAKRASFTTAAGDTVLRWHGSSEAVTASVVQAAANAFRTGSCLTECNLAPCHWFSSPCQLQPDQNQTRDFRQESPWRS
jgi:urease accessory protein